MPLPNIIHPGDPQMLASAFKIQHLVGQFKNAGLLEHRTHSTRAGPVIVVAQHRHHLRLGSQGLQGGIEIDQRSLHLVKVVNKVTGDRHQVRL